MKKGKTVEIFAEEGEVASNEEEVEELEEEQLSALNQSLASEDQQQAAGFDGKPLQIDTSDETKLDIFRDGQKCFFEFLKEFDDS